MVNQRSAAEWAAPLVIWQKGLLLSVVQFLKYFPVAGK